MSETKKLDAFEDYDVECEISDRETEGEKSDFLSHDRCYEYQQ